MGIGEFNSFFLIFSKTEKENCGCAHERKGIVCVSGEREENEIYLDEGKCGKGEVKGGQQWCANLGGIGSGRHVWGRQMVFDGFSRREREIGQQIRKPTPFSYLLFRLCNKFYFQSPPTSFLSFSLSNMLFWIYSFYN